MSARPVSFTKATRRFPFRTRPVPASVPERFDLSLRTGSEERRVRWDSGHLKLESLGPRSLSAVLRPSLREWERFWHAVTRLGVWQWADGYDRGGRSGSPSWSLELVVGDRRLRTSGFDAYPPLAEGPEPSPEFARFCAAVSRLVGGRLDAQLAALSIGDL
jgi:hypothetical protein